MSNVREFVRGLNLSSGSYRRVDCPNCGGRRTLSVENQQGSILYNCFRASCGTSGAIEGKATLGDLQLRFKKQKQVPFIVPGHFVEYVGGKLPFGILEHKDVMFDPKERRVVFFVRNQKGEIVDAIGRGPAGVQPKWKRYGSSSQPFVSGPYSGIGVLVEDCYSAIKVGETGDYTGVALLGTNLHSGVLSSLSSFRGVIVALDYDATGKAIGVADKISWLIPTTFIKLTDDLKYFTTDEIKAQLKQAREYLESSCQKT